MLDDAPNRNLPGLKALFEELEAEKAITYFATSLLTQSTLEEVLWDVVRNCISRLNFVDCVIYWLDVERGVLLQKAAYGPKSPANYLIDRPIEIALGQGIVGSVALSGKAERIGNTSLDGRYIKDDCARLSEITVPILLDGRVLGVIDAEHSELDFFKPRHLKILSTVATLCAQKVKQMTLEQAYQRTERQLAETRKRVAETKLLALRIQMSPHFIFNSLNSINSFILQNEAENASAMLTKFSRLMRQILDNTQTEWVSIRHEFHALQLYIELERLRCDNHFEIAFEISDTLDQDRVKVPPLMIHPYVENAIWHGLLPKKAGVRKLAIHCREQGGQLVIEIIDSGIGRAAAARLRTSPPHFGSKLVRERLRLMNEIYDLDARMTSTDLYSGDKHPAGTCVNFTLKLPTP
ncbi:GAF domain-containing protein [Cytophagaceae bacterium SJW1-29]|uniref:GAF domain-containing protein n=2 Tax=Salmonirosea aquatica TaxID=2654236 RepID=A0A7C9BHT3_9BACT|nr:GAF domain-containing protein [Cytophagaceae bacterium SJW1-29]